MIAQIRGVLIQKDPGVVVVETQGIGYQVYVSLMTFYELPDVGHDIRLYTHTHVREDLLQLYGFFTLLEKELFQILIGVSGIGPKLALNILSGIPSPELIRSLSESDVARLLSVPGIGRKTAERMLLDLKEKASRMIARISVPRSERRPGEEMNEDIVSALVNLGYKKGPAERVVERILRQTPEINLEEALKASLQILSAG